ncbi:MAG: tetratricopeptide (TPR) repeat protein [Myxococcota bacterium]|jgi:tetratricopeptide (TPR) repeat protein
MLLALTPLCKESYLLAPLIGAAWCLGDKRLRAATVGLPLLGVAAVLGLRSWAAVPLPVGAAASEPVAALGGLLLRGGELVVQPAAADIAAPYVGHPLAGAAALGLGALAWGLAWGRPRVAALAGALVVLLPAAPAAAQIGLIADRYFYLPLAFVAVVAAGVVEARLPEGRWRAVLWGLPLILAPLMGLRAAEWTSDARIFGASLARDPSNPHAAFHVAYDLHQRAGDCAAAEPLYRQAVSVEPRAGRNLQACLLELGRLDEAAAMGEQLWATAPGHAGVAANTARAMGGLGALDSALSWAGRAIDAAPERADLWVLRGNLRGLAGVLDEAEDDFRQALALAPGEQAAQAGLEAIAQARGEER